jgi:chromosome segregation ATPase
MLNSSGKLMSELRSELERLKPAVELIDQVVAYTTLIKEQRDAIQAKALEILEITTKAEDALKDLVNQELKRLISEHELQTEKLVRLTREVTEKISTIATEAIGSMADFAVSAVKQISGKAEDTIKIITDQVIQIIQNTQALHASIASLVDYLEQADIPKRLESVAQELENIQSQLTGIENAVGRLYSMLSDIDVKLNTINNEVIKVDQKVDAFQRKQEQTFHNLEAFLISMRSGQNSVGNWIIILSAVQLILIIILLLKEFAI